MRRRSQGIRELREAQEKSNVERQRILDRLKQQNLVHEQERKELAATLLAKRNKYSFLKIDDALKAAKKLQFLDLEADVHEPKYLNRPTLVILESFLKVLHEKTSVACLQWPRGLRDASIFHPLAMLALLGSSPEQITKGFKWCSSVPDFRTLCYPWRGSGTGTAQRHILIERNGIVESNKLHLSRRAINEKEFSDELGKLHLTLGHLSRLQLRDSSKPHLAHPTVGELYPAFGALGGDETTPFGSALYELFGRVRHGAALDRLQDYRENISLPATAPFGFFGICPRSNVKEALKNSVITEGQSIDICLLDLGPPGLARLGHAWEEMVEKFLKAFVVYHPETPVFAITQDIYVHRRCVRLLGKVGLIETGPKSIDHSRIFVRSSEDCLSPDIDIGEVTEVNFKFHSTGGQGVVALRALSDAARSSDPSTAGLIRNLMGNVRRAMSLPCGLSMAHNILEETDAGAEIFLERRSAGTVLSVVKRQMELVANSNEHHMLRAAEEAVSKAFDEFEADTPIGSMLEEMAGTIARKSSATVIAFSSDYDLLLGQHRICGDDEQGEQIKRRVASGFIRLTTLQELDVELEHIETGSARNTWKRLIVVAPPRDTFSILLGRKWLPEEVIVLTDREFVKRLELTYSTLATHPDLAGVNRIGNRLSSAAEAAKVEASARDVRSIDLDLEPKASFFNNEKIVDLVGSEEGDDDRDVITFALESGRSMRVRPGSLIIRHDRFADLNPFQRSAARDIEKNDIIVVPDQAFVQEARAVLPVRVLAHARVQIYHAAIEAALPNLPGQTQVAKARYVIDKLKSLGARSVVEATALDWLNVAEHKLLPPERLRPHAPQRWEEFRAFMSIINVPNQLAEVIWREGVEPLRIDRRRAGARMAQAFVSVLVDPHGGSASMPRDVKEGIVRLRRQAMEHLDGVISVTQSSYREVTKL